MIRPASMDEAQFQHALTLLAKARLRPFANPRLAAVVQEFVSTDLRDLSHDSQRRAGYRPGAMPAVPQSLIGNKMFEAATKRQTDMRALILGLLQDGQARTTSEMAAAMGYHVDRVRIVAQGLIADGQCHQTNERPNRYFVRAADKVTA